VSGGTPAAVSGLVDFDLLAAAVVPRRLRYVGPGRAA